jgi:3-dehydroquinate dehydratase
MAGKICVPLAAETAAELVDMIAHAEKVADVIELRFDAFRSTAIKHTRQLTA